MIVERGGVALNVVAEGAGPALVLLHGHALDLRVWDEAAPALAARGFRVIRYDQRGHGRSGSPAEGYRWEDHAADLAAVVEGLDAAPAHVAGLSKGGGIALEFAVRRPEAVRTLTLFGPLVPDLPISERLAGDFRTLARAIRERGPQEALRSVWVGHPLIAPAAKDPGTRERLEAMFNTFPAGEYLASRRDPPDRDRRPADRLAEIAVPVLVVRGDGDLAEFAAMAEVLVERVAGARLEVVPSCGHLVPLERAEATVAALARFLGAAPGGGPPGAP